MASRRWTVSWENSLEKPAFYHCISRVVDRKLAFGPDEKEKFRTFMRMQEGFTGCRVVTYCLMCNHIHLMLEVPPMPVGGLSDELLLERLRAIYDEGFVDDVAKELADARENRMENRAAEIHGRFTYRMHDLSEFMKTLMQRFTKWFNRTHDRRGNLWEDVFKSVVVEDGVAAKTIAAYIDLNPVRAGMVRDPAEYRWSGYGEAIGGGPKGNGKKARAGLVRALKAHKGFAADDAHWAKGVGCEYRMLLMMGAGGQLEAQVTRSGGSKVPRTRKGLSREDLELEQNTGGAMPLASILRIRVRYFSDGVVIGSRSFVNEMFVNARNRFGPTRKDGARKLRGIASPAAGVLWSLRDLRTGISGVE